MKAVAGRRVFGVATAAAAIKELITRSQTEIRDTPLGGQPDGHAYRGPDRVYSERTDRVSLALLPRSAVSLLGRRKRQVTVTRVSRSPLSFTFDA